MSADAEPPRDDVDRLSSESDEESGAARIADPDDYNVRRRLQQLHDAKERVGKIAEKATLVDMTDRDFSAEQKNELVAEAVVDYINELRAVLARQEKAGEFLEESIAPVDGDDVSIADLAESRGRLPHRSDRANPLLEGGAGGIAGAKTPPFVVSMMARSICDDYFERIAGAELEKPTPPPGANPVDPAGRFDE